MVLKNLNYILNILRKQQIRNRGILFLLNKKDTLNNTDISKSPIIANYWDFMGKLTHLFVLSIKLLDIWAWLELPAKLDELAQDGN